MRSYTLAPYGLVNKAGVWYLVADHDGEPRLFRAERAQSAVDLAVPDPATPDPATPDPAVPQSADEAGWTRVELRFRSFLGARASLAEATAARYSTGHPD